MRRYGLIFCLVGLMAAPALLGACRPDPTAVDYAQRARRALDQNDLASARSYAELAADTREGYRDAAAIRAEVARRLARKARDADRPKEAFDRFLEAAEHEPSRTRRAEDLAAAIESGTRAEVPKERLADIASRAVEADPSHAYARQKHARLWDAVGESKRAIDSYLWLWQTDRAEGNDGFRLGMLYQQTGQLDDAVAIFEKVLENDPENVQAAMNLASLYTKRGQPKRARRVYREMLERHPEQPGILLRYARFLRRQGETDRANELRRRAREAMPGVEERDMRSLE